MESSGPWTWGTLSLRVGLQARAGNPPRLQGYSKTSEVHRLIAPATLTEYDLTPDIDQNSSLYPSKIYTLGAPGDGR